MRFAPQRLENTSSRARPRDGIGARATRGTSVAERIHGPVEKVSMRSLTLSIVVCAACGSSSPNSGDDAPDAKPVTCEPKQDVVDLAADHGWAMQGMSADARGPWVVVDKRRDGVSSLVIADRTGEVTTLVDGLTDTSGVRVAPLVVDDKRCIAMHFLDETFQLACEDGTIETPDLELGGKLTAIATSKGTVHVFGQQFAAYHELRREDGVWREVEKFESSISEAEDAVAAGASFASCFLSSSKKAGIDFGPDIAYGASTAKWCRLIPGEPLGVLSDLGLATFSGNVVSGWVPTAVAAQRPAAVGRMNGAPVAVVRRDLDVELQPLPTGTPILLRTAANSAENTHAVVRDDRVEIISVKALLESPQTRYQLISSTHCF